MNEAEHNSDMNSELVRYSNGPKQFCKLNVSLFRSKGVWLIGCVTDGLNNKLLVRYSCHVLNNKLLVGIWIANKKKFAIKMFPLFRCSLFRSPLYIRCAMLCGRQKVLNSNDPNTGHPISGFNWIFNNLGSAIWRILSGIQITFEIWTI